MNDIFKEQYLCPSCKQQLNNLAKARLLFGYKTHCNWCFEVLVSVGCRIIGRILLVLPVFIVVFFNMLFSSLLIGVLTFSVVILLLYYSLNQLTPIEKLNISESDDENLIISKSVQIYKVLVAFLIPFIAVIIAGAIKRTYFEYLIIFYSIYAVLISVLIIKRYKCPRCGTVNLGKLLSIKKARLCYKCNHAW